jgi:hypothetical protein
MSLEARGGIEPPIKALQASALPLGDRATELAAFAPTDKRNLACRKTKTHRPFALAVGA